jgi:hypothetical protein
MHGKTNLFTSKYPCVVVSKNICLWLLPALICLSSCKHDKKVYLSSCNNDFNFKKVTFSTLIDSIERYDQQYIEVQGTYKEGKDQSALVNDSTFVDHSSTRSLWVNFSQDCPLYLEGTHKGLFEYNDGKFTQISNQTIIIRGRIDVRHKGHLGSYRGEIDRVSYIKL